MSGVHGRQDECTIAGLYDLSSTIGKGHFAVVKLAKHVFTGEKVAVKVIDKTKLDPVSRAHLFQEVRCMKLVQHPHIVRLYEVIDTQTKLYLILELGDGDMYDHIMNFYDRGLDVDTARMYFRQILEAISYCHDLHVVHRDLKPENVIFFEKLGIVKLTDFGFSNRFEPDTKLETSCGSLAYSAPEILLGDSYDAPAVDVWSLGVLLYMLVCGEPPFQEANDSETLTMIMDCKYRIPPHLPPQCASLISSMLKREPKQRISLKSIMEHPWVNAGGRCCLGSSCVALVGREHLAQEEQDQIIDKMVEGGIATKADIIKALEKNEYSNVTATFYLLAERKLKKQHQELQSPVTPGRPASAIPTTRPPRLEHSLSIPGTESHTSEQIQVDTPPHSAPYDTPDDVFGSSSGGFHNLAMPRIAPDHSILAPLSAESSVRKFSLICEEEEEDSEAEELRSSYVSCKETKSATWSNKSQSTSRHSSVGNTTGQMTPDFEQSLSNMSLRRVRQPASNQNHQNRTLRTVTSSPQLLPLKQIHEEGEGTSDEDALSVHSQTSLVRVRHSSLSMASPEIARKILSKKTLRQGKSCSSSDTSDNDEEKHREIPPLFNLPTKRKDSSDNSSDNDGPSAGGVGAASNGRHKSNQSQSGSGKPASSNKDSPCAKKKYGGGGQNATIDKPPMAHLTVTSNHSVGTSTSFTTCIREASTNTSADLLKGENKKNANNNNKDDNSLRALANKIVDSSLARLSNFSLASQSSSISSRSSAKYSDRVSTTPRSSQRRSDKKFSKARLVSALKKDFTDMSDKDSLYTDSESSLPNSLRIKFNTAAAPSDYWNRTSVIAEEQQSTYSMENNKKKSTDCCTVM